MLVVVPGLPIYYPSLYVTKQVRNKSLSFSVIEAILSDISVLLRFLYGGGENIERRFREGKYFEKSELDAIRDYCQIKFRSRTAQEDLNGQFALDELKWSDEKVSAQTEYVHLSIIAKYLRWLAVLFVGE